MHKINEYFTYVSVVITGIKLTTSCARADRWTIRARVSQKSNVRTWSNSRGEGKLFSMNLIDESGEIRCTLFKESVDRFYELVQVNKVRTRTAAAMQKFCGYERKFLTCCSIIQLIFTS